MMSELDQLLAAMRALPADPRLDTLEGTVMAGIVARHERGVARRGLMLAGALAAGIGWIGSLAPGAPARAASLPPLIGMSAYAPSSLLGE
jgi:hypothetical protein